MGIGTECKKGNSEKRADMVLWDGMGWDDDDWKVWGVGAERKACACLKWWHEVKGTVLKVGGYPDTSTPYGAKLVKAKGFSIYFGLSLWVWVWVWVYWVVPYNPSTKKIYLLLNAFAFIGQCQHHYTSLSLSLYTLPIGVNSLILLLSMTWLFFPSFLFPIVRVWHYTLFNIKKKKKEHFTATTACYISFSPFLPYLRAFCPPNSPPLFQIKDPFNYHQSTLNTNST